MGFLESIPRHGFPIGPVPEEKHAVLRDIPLRIPNNKGRAVHIPHSKGQLQGLEEFGQFALLVKSKMIDREKAQVSLAKKDFYPDFNLAYAWQRTDPSQFPAYYMLTFGVRVPIYHNRKQKPEVAQAEAALESSRSQYEAQTQQVAAELRNAYDTAQRAASLLEIYRGGLLPQARASFQAGLAAYQNNRQDFQATLMAFRDLLQLDQGYWQSLADHETALARLEELTGLALHQEGESQ